MNILGGFQPFLTMDISLWEKVARTVVVYLAIAILIRLGGKRLLAQMNSLDLVVVLLLSNVVQNAIIGPDNSVLGGVVGAVVLVAFNAMVDGLAERSPGWHRALIGAPSDLISRGVVNGRALRKLGISRHELGVALRRQGAESARVVQLARIEPEGEILVDLLPEHQAVTRADLDAAVAGLVAVIRSSAAGGSATAEPAATS